LTDPDTLMWRTALHSDSTVLPWYPSRRGPLGKLIGIRRSPGLRALEGSVLTVHRCPSSGAGTPGRAISRMAKTPRSTLIKVYRG